MGCMIPDLGVVRLYQHRSLGGKHGIDCSRAMGAENHLRLREHLNLVNKGKILAKNFLKAEFTQNRVNLGMIDNSAPVFLA